jgi:hypothetical protein
MSSKNEHSFDTSHWLVAAACICFVILTYLQAIVRFFSAFLSIVIGAVLLLGYIAGAWHILHRKRSPAKFNSYDVDVTDIENSDLDEPEEPKKELQKQEIVVPSENKREKYSYIEDPRNILESPLHRIKGLSNPEYSLLLQNNYVKREFVPFGKGRREWYLIKEQPRKSLVHTFATHKLVEVLRPHVTAVHVTEQQDVAIFHKGTDYLVCAVTPAELRPKSLRRKAEAFHKQFGAHWWFFTTQSAYAKSFERYGPTITRNQIEGWIDENFSKRV